MKWSKATAVVIMTVIAPVAGLMLPSVAASTRVQHFVRSVNSAAVPSDAIRGLRWVVAQRVFSEIRNEHRMQCRAAEGEAEEGTFLQTASAAGGLQLATWSLAFVVTSCIALAFGVLHAGTAFTGMCCALFFAYAGWTQPVGENRLGPDWLMVGQSTITGAGMGLFAARDLREGLVLGTYPGRVWDTSMWLLCKGFRAADLRRGIENKDARVARKHLRQRRAKKYLWILSPSLLIDPTDCRGLLRTYVPHISNTLRLVPPVKTLLCRINEPPTRRGRFTRTPNVEARLGQDGGGVLGGRSVELVLIRPVSAGSELLLDYGSSYDRSRYSYDFQRN